MFILGCHRSGTSYLSSVIIKSLSEINNLETLDTTWVKENPSNPNGHFESKRLKQANNTFLNLIGFSWDYPPLYKPKWDSILESFSLEELRKDFITWIENKAWVDKDPRLSITRELYLHIFLREVMSIFIVRHPFQVMNSLYNRDGIPTDKGICIWLIYNFHILNSKCSEPKLTVNFNNIENFNYFYADSLSKNMNSYLSFDDQKSKELNESLRKNFTLLLDKKSIRASSDRIYENSASQNLIETSLKCYEIFNKNPEDFDFKKATKLYNSYFFSVIHELTNIFPYPYNPVLTQEDPKNIFLPNLNYSSKNLTFKKSIASLIRNYGDIDSEIKKLASKIDKIDFLEKRILTLLESKELSSNQEIKELSSNIDTNIDKIDFLEKRIHMLLESKFDSFEKKLINQEIYQKKIDESNKKIFNQYKLIKNSKFWKLIRFFDKFFSFLK